jgi:transposase
VSHHSRVALRLDRNRNVPFQAEELNAMTSLTRLRDLVDVVVGVDTHTETHTAAIVDAKTAGVIEDLTVPATSSGYQELVEWVDAHTDARAWAVEGTSSHGCGLARLLADRHELVVELDRPVRAKRRHGVKSDKDDAIRAAREALSRDKLGTPRSIGDRQALAVLLAGRRSAVQAAGDAARQLIALIVAAPEPLRAKFAGLTTTAKLAHAAELDTESTGDAETRTTMTVLRCLADRHRALTAEAATHQRAILAIVEAWRPDLLAQHGVGAINAATILCAWSHPGRIHSEAAFAMLGGVAPIPASSGQTTRHRLNRFGDRGLNRVLHMVVTVRMRTHQPTRDYIARRTAEGKTPREIRRCLKRYIARDLYRLLEHRNQTSQPIDGI